MKAAYALQSNNTYVVHPRVHNDEKIALLLCNSKMIARACLQLKQVTLTEQITTVYIYIQVTGTVSVVIGLYLTYNIRMSRSCPLFPLSY